jgi:hypothetical protein
VAEQPADILDGQGIDIFGRTVAVWGVRVIAEIEEPPVGQPVGQGAQDGQAAMSGIEDSDHGRNRRRLVRDSVTE